MKASDRMLFGLAVNDGLEYASCRKGVGVSAGTFNLAPPPDLQGLDPDRPVTAYQRHLPHWRQAGATYFVTFRLGDSLPTEKRAYLYRLREHWEQMHPTTRTLEHWESLVRELFRYEDACLDEGYGACHFNSPQFAAYLAEAMMHFQNQRHFTSCWVIMPNHCHLIIRPFDGFELETILKTLKGVVAHQINLARNVVGSLWQEESYDRIVRDEEHLWRVIQYIGRNPSQAKLPRELWRRWIDPTWEAAGWKFADEPIKDG